MSHGTLVPGRAHAERALVLLEARYRFTTSDWRTTVAAFRGGRLDRTKPYVGRFERLLVSTHEDVQPVPLERQPYTVRLGIGPTGPAGWLPGGHCLAAATRASIFVMDLAADGSVRIPVTARDLAWR